MSKSKIEWTDETWNPVTGCTRVSAGCDNCYAARMTKRLAGHPNKRVRGKYIGLINPDKNHFNGMIKIHPELLDEPLRWRRPRQVFVCSMSDLFHPEVPFGFIAKVWGIMASNRSHTFQVLTKRPERAAEFFRQCGNWEGWITHNGTPPAKSYDGTGIIVGYDNEWPAPNVWLGTSVEDQQSADDRIPHLLQCPAAVRFLSCEPLLAPVNFLHPWLNSAQTRDTIKAYRKHIETGLGRGKYVADSLLEKIHWIIVGGESGPGARPMHSDWARSLRDQCNEADVAFFFKQWGEYRPALDSDPLYKQKPKFMYYEENTEQWVVKADKKESGRLLDGREWNEMPGISEDARTCRQCGCTDDDCTDCIEKTGEPCHWVKYDLCSACAS